MSQDTPTPTPTCRLVRLPEVLRLTGLSKTRLYALLASDQFSRPVRLHGRAIAFYEHEVMQWIASRPRVGRSTRNSNASAGTEASSAHVGA
jgi:prophage regulatory protein